MKIKRLLGILCTTALLLVCVLGCASPNKKVKIGVSFGVGAASRWESEKIYMEERANELGAGIEVRLNRTDEPKTQQQDCFELIDSGIDVLILTPRDVTMVSDILEYAKKKKVPVISYARIVLGEKVDLFVGYDSNRIGQRLGQYLTELVDEGNYIVLSGDPNDHNATLLHNGAMRYIGAANDDINIILNTPVSGWSAEEAERLVYDAVKANDNQIDAIFAPNDRLAEAAAKALERLGVTHKVAITGMDAELNAIKRIVAGKQDVTIYFDLRQLANTAIEEAFHMAKGEKVNVNTEFDNQSGIPIASNLVTGQLITKENLEKELIGTGYFTHEQVYGN